MGKWILVVLMVVVVTVRVEGYMKDRIERLPGQPKVRFKQYAGYVDVDDNAGRSLFYYFVEASRHADKKPLTLWLNGGPGCSSVGGGAFTELGPFFPTGDGRGLRMNIYSWNKVSNILFVESPAGVGWSYSNTTSDYTVGDERTAIDMREFLLRWFDKFPKYKFRDLFLTGESYAGHYIPQLANVLLDYNEQSTSLMFNIKGVAVGNPLLRLERDAHAMYEYLWSHGIISEELWLALTNECNFEDYVFEGDHHVSQDCNVAIEEANNALTDYVNPYDVIVDVCYPQIAQQELQMREIITKKSLGVDVCMNLERNFYFNLPEVQRALHANKTNLPYRWTMCNGRRHGFLRYNQSDHNTDILPALKRIIEHQIPVWVYSGDQDLTVPFIGSRALVQDLADQFKFAVTVPYGSWFCKGQIGGWTTQYGNMLTFATVRGASHMVPFSQPARALALFGSFVHGSQLPNSTYPPI